jgi:hypothetical protein
MKHIKICKPKSVEAKNSVLSKTGAKKAREVKSSILMTEGHGCVPTGNIIDRD